MHEVWNILKRDKYTDKGAETIEKLHETLFDIYEKISTEDLQGLKNAMNDHLYETIDILNHLVK